MQRIEVDDQTAQRLADLAQAQGMTVAQFLNALVPPLGGGDDESELVKELEAELEALALDLPVLPRDFSRADIYDDHD